MFMTLAFPSMARLDIALMRKEPDDKAAVAVPSDATAGVLSRLAAGDEGAARECIRRYGPLVGSMARRLCPNEHDDAVQDAFLEIWKSAGRYDPRTAPEHVFVMTVARHRLVDRRRSAARRGPPLVGDDRAPDMGASPEVLADLAKCKDAVSALEEPQRRAVLLSCEGLTHEEIAETTNLPLGTVKSHVRRGLIAIRQALFGEES
jgi:RNA polymerase sigma-70 factor (ECF subfamily)